MKSYKVVLAALAASVLTLAVAADDPQRKIKKKAPRIELQEKKLESRPMLKGVKCPVSRKQVKEEHRSTFKGGTIYFCCGNCPTSFERAANRRVEVSARANHQLVATKQAQQIHCGVNGKGKVDSRFSTNIDGVRVHTCCKNCLAKLTLMDEKDQRELVFFKNFDKAFVVVKVKEKRPRRAGAEKHRNRDAENH